MKAIQLINKVVACMSEVGIPADLTVGTFKVTSVGSLHNWAGRSGEYRSSVITFELQFKPCHLQHLKEMGVKVAYETAKMDGLSPKALRYKEGREAIKQGSLAPYYYKGDPENSQTGVIDNWLNAQAQCQPYILARLEKFCRDNHMHHLALHNNTVLRNAGWPFKIKYPSGIAIESQYKNIKAIRRTAIGKPAATLLPIQKRVLNLL